MSDAESDGFICDIDIHAAKINNSRRIVNTADVPPSTTLTEDLKETTRKMRSTGLTSKTPNGPLHFHTEGMGHTQVIIKNSLGKKTPRVFIDAEVDEPKKKESVTRYPKSRVAAAGTRYPKRKGRESKNNLQEEEQVANVEKTNNEVEQEEDGPKKGKSRTKDGPRPDKEDHMDQIEKNTFFEEHLTGKEASSALVGSVPVKPEAIVEQSADVSVEDSASEEQFKSYCDIGDGLLANAAVDASDYTMFPDFNNPKPTDFCLIDVASLPSDSTLLPKPIPHGKIITHKYYGKPGFVCLPWDESNVRSDGVLLYSVIERELRHVVQNGLRSIIDFKVLMEMIDSAWDISAVAEYYEELETQQLKAAFHALIRRLAALVLRGKELFSGSLPILCIPPNTTAECSVTLSQEQCACLLACAFFGLFPARYGFNDFNMTSLFSTENPLAGEKLKFILHYFTKVLLEMPTGVVSFARRSMTRDYVDNILEHNHRLSAVGIQTGGIEDCHHALQVDFAHKFIGGGVLRKGAAQEEIRFLCSPELIVACLLCPVLRSQEAVFITGAQRFSAFAGYGYGSDSNAPLTFKKLEEGVNQDWDIFRRIRCQVVAMDAGDYRSDIRQQFTNISMERELVKAINGFYSARPTNVPVATGNWGCGVFKGDPALKFVLQLIAASSVGRPMIYCPFDEENTEMAVRLCKLRDFLVKENISPRFLHNQLMKHGGAFINSLLQKSDAE